MGEPIKLWKGIFSGKTNPEEHYEFEQFFNNVRKFIELRSKQMVDSLRRR